MVNEQAVSLLKEQPGEVCVAEDGNARGLVYALHMSQEAPTGFRRVDSKQLSGKAELGGEGLAKAGGERRAWHTPCKKSHDGRAARNTSAFCPCTQDGKCFSLTSSLTLETLISQM